jgi:hypothetical protein
VFISYRRQESSGIAGRLYDRLAASFGDGQVFMDVDTIALGVDFGEAIAQAVSNCTVLLAVIGPGWLTATDEDGQRRLDDHDDIVRLEIQTALERDIRVIPILVEGAKMPRRQQLPEELAGLARRNAHFMRHESFRSDADRLLEAIEPILPSADASPVVSGPAQVVPVAADPARVASEGQTVPGGSPQAHGPSRMVRVLPDHNNEVKGVAFSPDGRLLASAADDGRVRLWEVETGTLVRTLTGHIGGYGVAFSPNGKLLASAGMDTKVRLWEVETGKLVHTLTGYGGRMTGVAFSPNGKLLAFTGNDKLVRLWKVATGKPVHKLTDRYLIVAGGVAFSPDGHLLAAARNDKAVRLWDVATGAPVRTVIDDPGTLSCVAFSPDGHLLAGAGNDKAVRFWEVATGTLVRTLAGHTGTVWGVAFSPDGTLLASAGDDEAVRLWEVATGTLVRTLIGHAHTVWGVAFSPDGTLLASAGEDETVRLWD